jgi:hypothetical protein
VVAGELDDIAALCEDATGRDPVATLLALRPQNRLIRLLRARLLRDAVALDLPGALGYPSLAAMVERELKLSQRGARDLLAEARLRMEGTSLERAFVEGRISGAQTRMIVSILGPPPPEKPAENGGWGTALQGAPPLHDSRLEEWIARAEAVTHLQFQREVRLIRRTLDAFTDLHLTRPFPHPDLEHRFTRILFDRGWTPSEVEHRLGEAAIAARPPASPDADPAADPLLMRRLEHLLDLCILAVYPDAIDDEPDDRQTLPIGDARFTIHLLLPEPAYRCWLRVRDAIRAREGPAPLWAVFGYVVCAAALTWERHHGAQKPANHRILERDAYRCTAPGCTARKNLEVHHIVFRSRQGTDAPENLTTLCAFHHRQSIHLGSATLTGSAPDQLHWSLGAHRFHGHRRT